METTEQRMMRPEDYGRRVAISRAQIYNFLHRGMPSVKLGRSRRVLVAEADAWIIEHGSTAGDAA